MQRFCDIVLAGLGLVVMAPLLVPVGIVLRLTGESEVFFAQERIGKGGQAFRLLKFATMLKNSPNMGTGTVTVSNDPRVLPFGKLLRKTKINELPQLINVIKGDMSLIGPRPQTRRCFNAFPQELQGEITKVRPGLSGIGSVVFRGEEALYCASDNPDHFYDAVIMPYKARLEAWYAAHRSMSMYWMLLGLTLWVVVVPRSALVWSLFSELPRPPKELQSRL